MRKVLLAIWVGHTVGGGLAGYLWVDLNEPTKLLLAVYLGVTIGFGLFLFATRRLFLHSAQPYQFTDTHLVEVIEGEVVDESRELVIRPVLSRSVR